ncbi:MULTISPECIES: tetratricopeptide repeat protein [Pseudoalteromonas]|uniref:Ancillary SecYEG translocon subunit n=1 Tax=Pseudoalteromonas rubra TaxID=43658 RepID=A0A5S3UVT7_9GAMM|nr:MULTISPECIES: tetratricopeptide repeat protein [Pseudoalteromonas]MCG7563191.1 tetratricopeptide repeat protein [Pseudoalteromonas sp. McH1-42]MEC4090454.1 tetratricopeptide repeat protein [Pseudoalteromonas rubra]QPB84446.1 tetratricopeptide repeat protein [Pseudoalteromonas rubra]
MEIYSTEEQQAEAIKRFFRENGTSLIIGAVLGLGGLYGWKAYNQHQIDTAEAGSEAYNQLVDSGDVLTKSDDFLATNGESSYAVLAAFVAAKEAVEQGKLEVAQEKLSFAANTVKSPELKATAYLRLARVQAAREDYSAALATLGNPMPESFAAQVAEVKGDVLLAQGKKEAARDEYQKAVTAGGSDNNPLLQIKLDDLASTAAL